MLSGSTWNFNSPPQGDLGIWPNQKYSENTMCPRTHIASHFGLRQMVTNSLSSPMNHFECPALPVAIAQPSQAPRNFYSETNFSSYPSYHNVGNLSVTGVHPSVRLICSDRNTAMLHQHDFSAAARTETSYTVKSGSTAQPSYFQSSAPPSLHSDRSLDQNPGFLPRQDLVRQQSKRQTAFQESCCTRLTKYFEYNKDRISYSFALKREYCLFRALHLKEVTSMSTESWANTERSFFQNLDPSFEPPCGFRQRLSDWWGKRSQYLSKDELSVCPLSSSGNQEKEKVAISTKKTEK